jgi:hypothetical protein
MDIEEFYAADERRRRSEEIELGTEWVDGDGVRYELSWVEDTGELYVMREPIEALGEGPFGGVWRGSMPTGEVAVAVVGWIPDRSRMEAVLSGWEDAVAQPNGVGWLEERLRSAGIPTEAPTAS